MSFFDSLNFASSNEDGRTELTALAGARRMLCLTGSGTRPLDMLLSGAEVIALDLNPVQNALLRLKVAAISRLDHPALLAFLGIAPGDRMALYGQVRPALTPDDAAFWDARSGMIRRGIYYQGLWEKVLRLGARGTRLIRGRRIAHLFDAPTLEAQQAIWDRHFDDFLWHGSIRLLGRPWVWTRVIGEPGGAFLPAPTEVEARLAGAFSRAAGAFFFRQSDFASLILRGTNALPDAVPMHLRPENFAPLRAALPRLSVLQGGLTDLPRLDLGPIDAFSLSDFGSYCGPESYAANWDGVLATATPGARFCERVFMNDLALPNPRIEPDPDLSAHLTATDRAIIYQIRAGAIR